MTDLELQNLVEEIAHTYFHQPFIHQARFNSRLRTTGGRYLLTSHDIEINPQIATDYADTILVGVIKHELCHYFLHQQGRGYQHRQRDFRTLLHQVGGLRYAPPLTGKKRRLCYECQQCHTRYWRQHRINTNRYVCSRCHGHLVFVEKY